MGKGATLIPSWAIYGVAFGNPAVSKKRGSGWRPLNTMARYSLSDEGKVYHAINFGEDHPGYKPKDDEMPDDKPHDNDQRFCYYTSVKVWDTCQVKEERTLRVASDKVNAWLDLGQSNNPILTAVFPQSQEEANQGSTAHKPTGKGSKEETIFSAS